MRFSGMAVLQTGTKTARIWVCGHCGMKIFYGRPVERPTHECFCGGGLWHC